MAMIAEEADARALRAVDVITSSVLLAGNPRSHARRWSPARPCCRTQRSVNSTCRWTTWSKPLQRNFADLVGAIRDEQRRERATRTK